jgi:hypothetical protein
VRRPHSPFWKPRRPSSASPHAIRPGTSADRSPTPGGPRRRRRSSPPSRPARRRPETSTQGHLRLPPTRRGPRRGTPAPMPRARGRRGCDGRHSAPRAERATAGAASVARHGPVFRM